MSFPPLLQALVTLKTAQDGVNTIWVAESAGEVRDLVNGCEQRLLELTRVRGMKSRPFFTRPDNVANVEDAT